MPDVNDAVMHIVHTQTLTDLLRNHMATPMDLSTVREFLDVVHHSLSLPSSSPPWQEVHCDDLESMDLSAMQEALDEDYHKLANSPMQDVYNDSMQTEDCVYENVIELKVLLWNIHGNSSEGMAAARRSLVGEVVRKCNPDILLLQEVEARRTVEHIRTECQLTSFSFYHSDKSTEAYIVYDKHCFDFVKLIDLPSIIGDAKLLPDGVATRTGGNASQDFYNDRSCAIRLRHCHTRKELVLMSFHNASGRTGGPKPNIISYAKGFLDLVCMVHDHEGIPVISGSDFNCDRSALLEYARALRCDLPDYDKSERRRLCE